MLYHIIKTRCDDYRHVRGDLHQENYMEVPNIKDTLELSIESYFKKR